MGGDGGKRAFPAGDRIPGWVTALRLWSQPRMPTPRAGLENFSKAFLDSDMTNLYPSAMRRGKKLVFELSE